MTSSGRSHDSRASVIAVAHPNIALSKYWGKRRVAGNFPAVPSLSLTLEGLSTETSITLGVAEHDELVLNGAAVSGTALTRASAFLDRVRDVVGSRSRARIITANDFPTASGLASSASGFAALALAATRAYGLDWDVAKVSDLARRGSASAARSLFGGLVELTAGSLDGREEDILSAQPIEASLTRDLRVVVCVATEGAKAHGSTDAMRSTALRSPFYGAWLNEAPKIHESLKAAALAGDFLTVGALAEQSALAMHGCALSAGFAYFRDTTVRVIDAVRTLRLDGLQAFFTVDAGPHVKVFTRAKDVDAVEAIVGRVEGVIRTIRSGPGEGARIVAAASGASTGDS